jgi:hypothetical protein
VLSCQNKFVLPLLINLWLHDFFTPKFAQRLFICARVLARGLNLYSELKGGCVSYNLLVAGSDTDNKNYTKLFLSYFIILKITF